MNANTFDDVRVMSEAAVLANQGNAEEAVRNLDKHQFDSELAVFAVIQKARILEEVDVDGAWQTYNGALEEYPNNAAVSLRAGVYVYKRGDTEKAKQLLMRSWSNSATPEAGYYLGTINGAQGSEGEALKFFIQTAVLEGDGGYWRKRAETEARLR